MTVEPFGTMVCTNFHYLLTIGSLLLLGCLIKVFDCNFLSIVKMSLDPCRLKLVILSMALESMASGKTPVPVGHSIDIQEVDLVEFADLLMWLDLKLTAGLPISYLKTHSAPVDQLDFVYLFVLACFHFLPIKILPFAH